MRYFSACMHVCMCMCACVGELRLTLCNCPPTMMCTPTGDGGWRQQRLQARGPRAVPDAADAVQGGRPRALPPGTLLGAHEPTKGEFSPTKPVYLRIIMSSIYTNRSETDRPTHKPTVNLNTMCGIPHELHPSHQHFRANIRGTISTIILSHILLRYCIVW